MSAPAPGERPLSIGEKLKIGLVALAVFGAIGIGVWAYASHSEGQELIEAWFGSLQSGDYERAYSLLHPNLQKELGSAERLGELWAAAGVGELTMRSECSGMSPGSSTVKMHASVKPRASARPFALGPELTDRSCKGHGKMPLVVRINDGMIAAVRLDY